MNTYSNKISYIPYSDIDDVEGAIFILKDIVKISLKNKVDGKSVINYLGTYRFFKLYEEHPSVNILKNKTKATI